MRNCKIYIVFFIFFLVVFSCRKEEKLPEIFLPPTPILSVQSTWGVVSSSHVRLREKAGQDSRAIATLWRGSVMEIISREREKVVLDYEENYWYRISSDGLSGWVFGAGIDFYDSRSAADRASRELK